MDFDVSEFNRKIVLPDHTHKVLEEVSTYLNPESGEKTLIFAVNDAPVSYTHLDVYKRQCMVSIYPNWNFTRTTTKTVT